MEWPPLWSSGQEFLATDLEARVRFPVLSEKEISGSGTGSTQPREYNWGDTWQKSSGSCLENREYSRMDPSRWPRGTLYPQKLAITSPTSGGRSVGIFRSRSQATEFFFTRWRWLEASLPCRFTAWETALVIHWMIPWFGLNVAETGDNPCLGRGSNSDSLPFSL
jgi:hypothetical protein